MIKFRNTLRAALYPALLVRKSPWGEKETSLREQTREKLGPLTIPEYVQALVFIEIRHFRKACPRKYIHNKQIAGT